MAQTQLFYIGTSKKTEIRMDGQITYNWGSYGSWTKFKSPTKKSAKNVAYNKSTKNKAGASKYKGVGDNATHWGTRIPATATKTIGGVETTVQVRYYVRGYTIYTRTSALKKKKKMLKTIYDNANHPYQYRLQYKDKATYEKAYSQYVDGTQYIYFSDNYYDDTGASIATSGHLPHPSDISFSYSDVRKNFESSANNSESRDNKGKYVLSNVRANIMTMQLTWTGLTSEQGTDLLAVLNPDSGKNYLIVQYLDPELNTYKNGTFYASERNVTKYPNGLYKEVTVTLTEV